ncbi:hypothetical protein PCANC_00223 [Puccinia coronata f. sp. avenae]|uniref:Uncharacterized protein n=1 Tax=Puccinia coronata f. sp. avenae TaxID=200324 RepID=A0A2N5W9I7_9BASI|nr:hypothetical protein PCANC_00223 [Puccinia coronata f. sp. avenae]
MNNIASACEGRGTLWRGGGSRGVSPAAKLWSLETLFDPAENDDDFSGRTFTVIQLANTPNSCPPAWGQEYGIPTAPPTLIDIPTAAPKNSGELPHKIRRPLPDGT